MIPTGTCNSEGEKLYHVYNGYGNNLDVIGTYSECVVKEGNKRNTRINTAIGIKKKGVEK